MAKIYGLFGSMTGKLADTVMTVRNGVQIARKYQPVVFNPSTPAQVAVRARLKLVSQLSAVFGPGIAFRKNGIVSSRNMFTRVNMAKTSFNTNDSQAEIAMLDIDLTGSAVGLPVVIPTRTTGHVQAAMGANIADTFDSVVYVFVAEEEDNSIRLVKVENVTTPGEAGTFPTPEIPLPSSRTGYVYAYGIRLNSDTAKAKYLNVVGENPNAILDVVRYSSESEVTVSETAAGAFTAATTNNAQESPNRTKKN